MIFEVKTSVGTDAMNICTDRGFSAYKDEIIFIIGCSISIIVLALQN